MKSDPSSQDPLEALDKRLQQARKKPEVQPSGAGIAMRMGTDMVAGVMVGAGFGYFIDKTFGSLPLFLVIFLFIGAAAGVKLMIQTSNRYNTIEDSENDTNIGNE